MSKKVSKDGGGLRFNSKKIEVTQCPRSVIYAIASVLMANSQKYGGKYPDRNWERGMAFSTVMNSMQRHLDLRLCGEVYDKESGFPHTWHMATNAAFLVEYELMFEEGDDLARDGGGDILHRITDRAMSIISKNQTKK